MEKRLLVTIITVAVLAVGVVVFLMGNTTGLNRQAATDTTAETVKVTNPPEEELTGHFKLSDYENKIKNPREENFGPITDIKTLVRKTAKLWAEEFGLGLSNQKPYQVYFDQDTGAWLVCGSHEPEENKKSSVAYILVDHETGDVLAVWLW